MTAISDYLENALLDHTLRGVALPAIDPPWLALFSSDPTDAGTGDQIAVARQTITFGAPVNGIVANTADVIFPDMPSVTVSYIGIFDADTGGNLLYHGALAIPRVMLSGDTYTMRAGDLSVSLM